MLKNEDRPDCEWKQVVWHAKRREREPKALRHVRRHGFLIGDCTTGLDSAIKPYFGWRPACLEV